MALELDKFTEKWIQDKVDSGKYESVAEVVATAMARLEEYEQYNERLDDLRAEIQKGVDDKNAGRFSPGEEVFARLRARRTQTAAQRSGTEG
ncbi:hypothetical protein BH09SUM1_BH09SUM1_29790 [soil metagenome]